MDEMKVPDDARDQERASSTTLRPEKRASSSESARRGRVDNKGGRTKDGMQQGRVLMVDEEKDKEEKSRKRPSGWALVCIPSRTSLVR